jgi:putative flippase GtrA
MTPTFARYVAVQLAAYAVDMGGFAALLAAGMQPLAANVVSKILAGAVAFLLHRRFTFENARYGSFSSQLWRYVLVLLANIPASSAVLAALLHFIAAPVPAKFVADVLILAVTYWLSKRMIFRGRMREGEH